jgi:excisionase family DNA binding protein
LRALIQQALEDPSSPAALIIQQALEGLAAGAAQAATDPAAFLRQDWLTFEELAAALKRSPTTLNRWRTERRLPPSIKIGKERLFHRDSVRQWLRSLEQDDAARPKLGTGGWARRRAAAPHPVPVRKRRYLTPQERNEVLASDATDGDLAARFGVSRQAINKIRRAGARAGP